MKIKNNVKYDFRDMYNGQSFVIPSGKTVNVPDEAAKHFWGIGGGKDDIYLALRRSGHLGYPAWLESFEIVVKPDEETVVEVLEESVVVPKKDKKPKV